MTDEMGRPMAWTMRGKLSQELAERQEQLAKLSEAHPGWVLWFRAGTETWCAMPPRGYVWKDSASCLRGFDVESLEAAIGRFERGEVYGTD